MSAVAEALPDSDQLPRAFEILAERYDPADIDLRTVPARIRLSVTGGRDWDALLSQSGVSFAPALDRVEPDALLAAGEATWNAIAADVRGGMDAFRRRRLRVRRNLHLGVGFLAATSGMTEEGRLRFHSVQTRRERISVLEAGVGEAGAPPVLCLHGLGGTKASFMTTVAALADSHRVIAADLPGFGDSDKPLGAAYDAPYFSRAVARLLDALDIQRAHLVGNSMGGRIAIEVGLREPERVERIVLLSPALAWLRRTQWEWILQLARPRLGLIQPAPRRVVEPLVRRMVPGGEDGWAAAGVDEFLRAFLTPRGRAAFYAAGRNILLDPPEGEDGLWTRMAELSPETMFVWGRQDGLVPIGFMKHVERVLPAARHVELDCGHVPQMERPRETHAAMRDFLR
jgi:pimeloyl-ACP methyl ester carboxylesterase